MVRQSGARRAEAREAQTGESGSVVVSWPGSKRGRRLIHGDSLDSYLEGLTEKQASVDVNRNGAEGRHNSAGKWLQEKRPKFRTLE